MRLRAQNGAELCAFAHKLKKILDNCAKVWYDIIFTWKNIMKELKINAEHLDIAEVYLRTLDIADTAQALDISKERVTKTLNKREVKSFLSTIYQEAGYRNKHKLGDLMDSLIDKKLEELEDADIGSSKDITDLVALAHKMSIENKKLDIELEKVKSQGPSTQINVQNNYDSLVDRIMKAT